MKKAVRKGFVLVVSVVAMLIAGCQEQELPSARKTRAIVAENMQLKKELERRSEDIERLIELHDREIEKQEELLAKCLEEEETWKKKSRQNIRNQVKGVLDAVIEENAKLRQENEELKAQIEQLEAKVQRLEKKVEELIPTKPTQLE
jgi:outer membrane murein-binding lipoprotein Lpp